MHGDPAGAGLGRHVEQRCRDIVDQGGAGLYRCERNRPLGGVDRDAHLARELGHDRQDTSELLVLGNRVRTRPGRLATDVYHVCAGGPQAETVLYGSVTVEEIPPVGEGIRGDIEHTHDERTHRSLQ